MTASVDALITAAAAGLGRGVVREAARGDPGEAGVDDGPGARLRTYGADGWHRVQARIGELTAPVLADARRDATGQVNALISPGSSPRRVLPARRPRPLQAVELRIDKLRADPARDAQWTAEVKVVADEYAAEWLPCRRVSSRRRNSRRSGG